MKKPKHWKGKDLVGRWLATRKLDGVRALVVKPKMGARYKVVSRKNKPLYNLEHLMGTFTDAEVFCGSLKLTLGKVRASAQARPVKRSEVYQLDPPDRRLVIKVLTDPSAAEVNTLAQMVMAEGGEGIVLRSLDEPDKWLKVKGCKSYDVRVTGLQAGRGKHRGKLGALLTTKGKVGTGFSDKQRRELNTKRIVGCLIEAECTQLLPSGKFRHARFKRVRDDKPGGKSFNA